MYRQPKTGSPSERRQGLFNNLNDDYVRNFVADKCRILAIIGLHPYTFKPFTLAKTSLLFLQKWPDPNDTLEDYPVFTAVSQHPGKTKLGIRKRSAGKDGLPPNFVSSFLRTPWGVRQVQRLNRGVRGGHVYGQDVERFILIPVPDKAWLYTFASRYKSVRDTKRDSISTFQKAVATFEAALLK